MNLLENSKVHVFGADELNAATLADTELDCLGYDRAEVILITGNTVGADVGAFDIHCADSAGFTPGTGNIVFDSSANSGAHPLATETKETVRVTVDLRGLGRYMQVVVTAGASASDLACIAILSRASQSPIGRSDTGADVTFFTNALVN